jgi:hypothetical protein
VEQRIAIEERNPSYHVLPLFLRCHQKYLVIGQH